MINTQQFDIISVESIGQSSDSIKQQSFDYCLKQSDCVYELKYLTEYVYNYAYNYVKSTYSMSDGNSIDLNPYLRTLTILVTAYNYIKKSKFRIFDVTHFIQYVKPPSENIKLDFIDDLRYLLKYNGEVKISISDEEYLEYDYSSLVKLQKKYLPNYQHNDIKYIMYDTHPERREFMKRLKSLHCKLASYQLKLRQQEITNMKLYITKMLIQQSNSIKLDLTSTPNLKLIFDLNHCDIIVNDEASSSTKQESQSKFRSESQPKYKCLIRGLDEDILMYLNIYNVNFKPQIPKITLHDLITEIQKYYCLVLNVNPLLIKKVYVKQNLDYFDFVIPELYSKLIKAIEE